MSRAPVSRRRACTARLTRIKRGRHREPQLTGRANARTAHTTALLPRRHRNGTLTSQSFFTNLRGDQSDSWSQQRRFDDSTYKTCRDDRWCSGSVTSVAKTPRTPSRERPSARNKKTKTKKPHTKRKC